MAAENGHPFPFSIPVCGACPQPLHNKSRTYVLDLRLPAFRGVGGGRRGATAGTGCGGRAQSNRRDKGRNTPSSLTRMISAGALRVVIPQRHRFPPGAALYLLSAVRRVIPAPAPAVFPPSPRRHPAAYLPPRPPWTRIASAMW